MLKPSPADLELLIQWPDITYSAYGKFKFHSLELSGIFFLILLVYSYLMAGIQNPWLGGLTV
jgi:hypothetical protein